jgi:hypothetical protein
LAVTSDKESGASGAQLDDEHPSGATVFLFNHLLNSGTTAGADERVLTFLITCRSNVNGQVGELGIARHMARDPDRASEVLLFTHWADQWSRPADSNIDVALLAFFHLESHARRKGWEWNTQEVTDGMLLQSAEQVPVLADELAAYGYEPSQLRNPAHQRPVLRPISFQHLPNGAPGVVGTPAIGPVVTTDAAAHGYLPYSRRRTPPSRHGRARRGAIGLTPPTGSHPVRLRADHVPGGAPRRGDAEPDLA